MSRTIIQSTQIGVTLSLNIVTQTGRDTRLETLPLVQLTPFIFWLWSVWQTLNRFGFALSQVISEAIEPIKFTTKLLSISFVSLAFGLGVWR